MSAVVAQDNFVMWYYMQYIYLVLGDGCGNIFLFKKLKEKKLTFSSFLTTSKK